MPQPTDLVTDLPADFEVFGQAVATSLADLLGGTSGQVLAKNSNTDMDFVWVTTDDANAIQNSIVDAKGDLIAASAADTPARLAVGNNGETLVADSSTSTGLRWQAPIQQNPVLNSAFQVWQRGTSVSGAGGGAYTADRWNLYAGSQATVSRQATGDTTNLPFIQYCARVQRNNASTDVTSIPFTQSFETINSIPYAGKTVTVSFYARRGANFSSASNVLNSYLVTGTGTDQNQGPGYTGQAVPGNTAATLTTTWQRFSYTATLATNANELAIQFQFTPVGTAGAADFYEVTGVQLEVGSVATPFKTYAGTIQGELAACQRYYQRFTATGAGIRWAMGQATSTTSAFIILPYPVTMRTAPSALEQSGTAGDYTVAYEAVNVACTSVPTFGTANLNSIVVVYTTPAQLTAGQAVMSRTANATAYLGWSAEL